MARASDSFFLIGLFRDKTFQMRQIRRVLLLAGLFVLQSTVLLGIFYHFIVGRMVAGTAPMLFAAEDIQRMSEQVPEMGSVLGRWIIIMLLINLALTAVVGIYITRKLGSPLLAIRRVLNEVGAGNLEARLRDSDKEEFSELTEALETAMDSVRDRIAAATLETDKLARLQEQPEPDPEEMRQAVSACQQALHFFAADEQHSKAANG